ncbi:unnamed protein product [Hymenolepis diminuta]|uniref:Uncharacterized protein n=1 Tax=Hymenolepis diminuta TaxID=6216 RepID=A0A564YA40_HYMDI|nr:unnamed protein product [Hymenolepis diminuta]
MHLVQLIIRWCFGFEICLKILQCPEISIYSGRLPTDFVCDIFSQMFHALYEYFHPTTTFKKQSLSIFDSIFQYAASALSSIFSNTAEKEKQRISEMSRMSNSVAFLWGVIITVVVIAIANERRRRN